MALVNNTFYSSHDTITCKLIASTSCGTLITWSNPVILPDINDPAVPSVTVTPSATTVCSGVGVNFTALPVNVERRLWVVCRQRCGSASTQLTASFVNNTSAPQTHTVYCNAIGNGSGVLCLSGGPNARSATITITVLPRPAVVATATNVTGCAGSPVTLSGSPAGGVFSKPNPYLGPSTSYSYSYLDQNGCSSTSAPATIMLTTLPPIGVVNPRIQHTRYRCFGLSFDTVCAGQAVTLPGLGRTPTHGRVITNGYLLLLM
jgi:hypothetical protein